MTAAAARARESHARAALPAPRSWAGRTQTRTSAPGHAQGRRWGVVHRASPTEVLVPPHDCSWPPPHCRAIVPARDLPTDAGSIDSSSGTCISSTACWTFVIGVGIGHRGPVRGRRLVRVNESALGEPTTFAWPDAAAGPAADE